MFVSLRHAFGFIDMLKLLRLVASQREKEREDCMKCSLLELCSPRSASLYCFFASVIRADRSDIEYVRRKEPRTYALLIHPLSRIVGPSFGLAVGRVLLAEQRSGGGPAVAAEHVITRLATTAVYARRKSGTPPEPQEILRQQVLQ